jgi:transcriptional regulator with PAS, ATPase and Fis domain
MSRPLSAAKVLQRKIEESATPLLALDQDRRVLFANAALAQWLGVQADDLQGQSCDYRPTAETPIAAALAALCPPPEAFTSEATTGFASRLASDGRPFERRAARYFRLPAGVASEFVLLVAVASSPAEVASGHAPLSGRGSPSPDSLQTLLVEAGSRLGRRYHISQLVGVSDAIASVREQVRLAAESEARVLVIGPPGSGREHIARTIHYEPSSRAAGLLTSIACELVDAEQMQRALTTLLRRHHEQPTARPATALLLNIDRLRATAQQELIGFLNLPGVHLRTLATARRSLLRLSVKGKFRADLAHALSTLTIRIAPLRSRPEDIPLLAQHFLASGNEGPAKQLSGFHDAALELLLGLPWPGNADELAAAVRAARERARGPRVLPTDFPDWVHLAKDAAAHAPRDEQPIELDAYLADIEKELLRRALAKARGNKSKAAELLGISRPRLLRRLVQLGLLAPAAAEEPVVFEPLDEP